MKEPLVSIIMSTYNGSKYIAESINSVLAQSYKNFEFIIINDSSTDNTEDIIREFSDIDQRIIYLKNTHNLRLTKSLNKGLSIAQGSYIGRIDDDDIRENDKLFQQVQYLKQNPTCGLCGTGISLINEDGNLINTVEPLVDDKKIRNKMLQANHFTHSSVLINKYYLKKVGGYYNVKRNGVEDYELWLRLGQVSKLGNISKPLTKYRRVNSSISRKNKYKQQVMSLKLIFLQRKLYPNFLRSFSIRSLFLILISLFGERRTKSTYFKFKSMIDQGKI